MACATYSTHENPLWLQHACLRLRPYNPIAHRAIKSPILFRRPALVLLQVASLAMKQPAPDAKISTTISHNTVHTRAVAQPRSLPYTPPSLPPPPPRPSSSTRPNNCARRRSCARRTAPPAPPSPNKLNSAAGASVGGDATTLWRPWQMGAMPSWSEGCSDNGGGGRGGRGGAGGVGRWGRGKATAAAAAAAVAVGR